MDEQHVVPVVEMARWLGLDPDGLGDLSITLTSPGRAPTNEEALDPLVVQAWLHGQLHEPVPDSGPSRLGLVREAAVALSKRQTLEAACSDILGRLGGSLQPRAAAILLDEAGEGLRRIGSVGDLDGPAGASIDGVAAWVAMTGEPLLLPGPGRIRLASLSRAAGDANEVLALPIASEGGRPHVLIVLREASAGPFSERDLAIATSAAAELALAVERESSQRALAEQLAEASLAQRQLEAYAHDIRQTFAAEKRRAEELAAALKELQQTYLATVHGLAIAVEAKDALTAGHIVRVTNYGLALLRLVLPDQVNDREYEYGFLLHDIGKLSVPDAILGKEGPLTEDEWTVMRQHPDSGRRILEGIPFLTKAKEMVYTHHERWDGKGYPRGLTSEETPVASRLFPVVDSYDAMTSDRPYRKAMPTEEALAELRRGSGTQFWPDAVDAFLSVPFSELEAIRNGPKEWVPQPSR
jgi:ribonuclease P protein subunit RPR2